MGQELFLISRIGTKRVIWLIGVIFAMILAFQCFELPYGFSSLLTAGKVSVIEQGGSPVGDPVSKSELVADAPVADSVNSTASHDSYGMENYTEVLEEQRNDGFVPEEDHTLKESLELDMDGEANNSSLSGDVMGPVENSTIDDDLGGNDQSFNEIDNSLQNGSIGINGTESSVSTLAYNNSFATAPAVPPTSSSSLIVQNTSNIALNTSSHDSSVGTNAPDKSKTSVEKTKQLNGDPNTEKHKPVFVEKKVPEVPFAGVLTISEMNKLLFESRSSYSSIVRDKLSCLSELVVFRK